MADLPTEVQARLVLVIDALADNPRPGPPLGKKLAGKPTRYRLKVPPYRVIYRVDPQARAVTVAWVGLRRDAYRRR